MRNYLSVCFLIIFLNTGCAEQKNISPIPSITVDQRINLGRPVNCNTAQQDIKILEDERASTAREILAGARAVFPISAAIGLLTGDYKDRFLVASGEYNHVLELKIDQIKKTCRLP